MENEKQSQIGFSDQFSYCNTPIKYEITENNTIQLYVEDCGIALGVTKKSELKDKSISITPRWDRIYEDLVGIEKIPNVGNFKALELIVNKVKSLEIGWLQLYYQT